MKQHWFFIIAFIFIGFMQSGASCTKVVTYAQQYRTDAISHQYSSNRLTALEKAKTAMEGMGLQVLRVDESRYQVTSGWMPVLSNSHYMNLFGRNDYSGSQGAYYQLVADVFTEGNKIKVATYTNIKSLAGKLESALVVEKKFLSRLDNLMRSPQIELTNVGMKER